MTTITNTSVTTSDLNATRTATDQELIADFQGANGKNQFTRFGHHNAQNTGHSTTNYWSWATRTGGNYDLAYGTLNATNSNSSSNNVMSVTTDGYILTPNRPAFCTSGTNYTQGSGLATIIPHTVDVNIGNHMNGSTGVFTAPIAGLYMFGFWGLSYPHGTEVNHIAYFKNGTQTFAKGYSQFNGTSNNHELASGSAIYQLAVNDEITLRYHRGSASGTAWQNQWTMHGHLIG